MHQISLSGFSMQMESAWIVTAGVKSLEVTKVMLTLIFIGSAISQPRSMGKKGPGMTSAYKQYANRSSEAFLLEATNGQSSCCRLSVCVLVAACHHWSCRTCECVKACHGRKIDSTQQFGLAGSPSSMEAEIVS